MLILPGSRALSDFRQRKLLAAIQQIQPSIQDVEAQYVHFIDTGKISAEERQHLTELLDYGSPFRHKVSLKVLLVVPRPGTISPWSSKATDIAQNAGLKHVRRIERGTVYYFHSSQPLDKAKIKPLIHDRMTEAVIDSLSEAAILFRQSSPRPLKSIDILQAGKSILAVANKDMGLALSEAEIDYIYNFFNQHQRNPTDVELMMFAQVNSEHTRHKVFNAEWVIDGEKQSKTLFELIKNSFAKTPSGIKSAYTDNAAVLGGPKMRRFITSVAEPTYRFVKSTDNIVIKAETHNHPTAISPFPGAATGIGGEIRDEAATGRGAKSKAGFCGYSVSNLHLPDGVRPWEAAYGRPERISSPLEIMLEAPIGGAGYANEFGRPNMAGYFRTYEQLFSGDKQVYGYHKPIMLAGGLGSISDENLRKHKLDAGDKLIVLGGPAMLIGLGGGAASSLQAGQAEAELDFASVQRGNAEMERRTQEVIDRCWALGRRNPIITIHDVGAGGLSNALPELVKDSGLGAEFDLRDIPTADSSLSPMEIWCNEAQERYVLAVDPKDLELFATVCRRERCPFAVVGEVKPGGQLQIRDSHFNNLSVDVPINFLFGNPPKLIKQVEFQRTELEELKLPEPRLEEAIERVLTLPAVGSKSFLVTIGDRTVGGLSVRDQMVGPWQVPVSDVAVMAGGFEARTGEAMAIGERPPLALISASASARMAVGEAITNIMASDVRNLHDVKLSANWMAAAGEPWQDMKLFEAVKVLGEEFCPALGVAIPVGKDSLSMHTRWQQDDIDKRVTAPLSVVISAYAPVSDTARTLTPQLRRLPDSNLILVDLGMGRNRLGGSALAQVYNQLGNVCPDIEPRLLKRFFMAITKLKRQGKILAYHDRSDGGLLVTVLEMCFAGRIGFNLDLSGLPGQMLDKLFSEELGCVIQVRQSDTAATVAKLKRTLGEAVYNIGSTRTDQKIRILEHHRPIYEGQRKVLEKLWADTSYRIQRLRDNPTLVDEESAQINDDENPGISVKTTFRLSATRHLSRPKVAILREQGVNGQVEMAAAFNYAGFEAVDVHMSDLMTEKVSLADFRGLVACGGFSYGDVLGAGEGWAKSILFNDKLRRHFADFFDRPDAFSLGVCNGCQALASLKELIPDAQHWPRFVKNSSEQFEGRLIMVKINESPSILFKNMAGSYLPIPVAHGEGRAELSKTLAEKAVDSKLVVAQFIDNYGKVSQTYPSNPNGSPLGLTAMTSVDGRATIIMPHPERAFLIKQFSWFPKTEQNFSPWFKIFQNARDWVG